MQSYVQLTLNEYDELKKVQVEATTLVEQTNKNLSRKLTEANEKITELESDLRKYAIGGMI
jgi:TRAP-type C4-dicarboxylate transport system substrate-binding protein